MTDVSQPPQQKYGDASYYLLFAVGGAVDALEQLLDLSDRAAFEDEGITFDHHAEMRLSYHTRMAILMAAFDLEGRINQLLAEHFGPESADLFDNLALLKKLTLLAREVHHAPLPGHVNEAFGELQQWRNTFAHGRLPDFPKSMRPQARKRTRRDVARAGIEVAETLLLLQRHRVVATYLDTLTLRGDEAAPESNLGVLAAIIEYLDGYTYDEQGQVTDRKPGHKWRERPARVERFGFWWEDES